MTAARLAAALAALLTLALAPPARAFEPAGRVSFHSDTGLGGSSAWDDAQVVGPTINLARDESDAWAGDIGGANVVLEVLPDRIRGAGVTVFMERKDGKVHAEGLVFGQQLRIDLGPKAFTGRYGRCSFDLPFRKAVGYIGEMGCMRGNLAFTSRATLQIQDGGDPPLHQLVLGLLGVLPLVRG